MYVDDAFGRAGSKVLHSKAFEAGICIYPSIKLPIEMTETDAQGALLELLASGVQVNGRLLVSFFK